MASPAVIVTGAAGFVGAHLVRALASTGRAVVATDLAPALPRWVSAAASHPHGIRYVQGDLLDEKTLDEIFAADTYDLVHVGALTRFHGEVRPTPGEAVHAFAVNALAPARLCARAAEHGGLRRLVHISTRSVFGRRPATTEPIGEGEPYVPVGLYGHSKAAGEQAVLACREELGLDAVVARITGVFGPWQGPRSPVARIIEAAAHGRPLRLTAAADQASEVTYVKDTVRGIVDLLGADRLAFALYHVSSGRMATLNEVVQAAHAAVPEADVGLGPGEEPGAWRRTALDVTRIAGDIGFRARWELPDAVADAIRAERTGSYGTEALESLRS